MFARSDPQWHWASLFICNLLCIDVHDGSGRFRHAFSDVLRMSGSRPSSAEKSSQERPFRLPAAHDAEVKRALALLNVPLSMATPLGARIRMKSSARHCEQSEAI